MLVEDVVGSDEQPLCGVGILWLELNELEDFTCVNLRCCLILIWPFLRENPLHQVIIGEIVGVGKITPFAPFRVAAIQTNAIAG